MERIDKQYAVIYIDRTGESIQHFEKNDGGFNQEMVVDYYDIGPEGKGFRQWNFYLIIAAEHVPADRVNEILEDDKYCRKYIMREVDIDSFVEDRFPDMREKHGVIQVLKGNDWKEAKAMAAEVLGLGKKNYLLKRERDLLLDGSFRTHKNVMIKGSWYRDHSLMHSLEQMDRLRAQLIRDPNINAIFFSHLSSETNIAEKKFKLLKKEVPVVPVEDI